MKTATKSKAKAKKAGALSRVAGYAKKHPIRIATTLAAVGAVGATYALIRRAKRNGKVAANGASKNGAASNGKAAARRKAT